MATKKQTIAKINPKNCNCLKEKLENVSNMLLPKVYLRIIRTLLLNNQTLLINPIYVPIHVVNLFPLRRRTLAIIFEAIFPIKKWVHFPIIFYYIFSRIIGNSHLVARLSFAHFNCFGAHAISFCIKNQYFFVFCAMFRAHCCK